MFVVILMDFVAMLVVILMDFVAMFVVILMDFVAMLVVIFMDFVAQFAGVHAGVDGDHNPFTVQRIYDWFELLFQP